MTERFHPGYVFTYLTWIMYWQRSCVLIADWTLDCQAGPINAVLCATDSLMEINTWPKSVFSKRNCFSHVFFGIDFSDVKFNWHAIFCCLGEIACKKLWKQQKKNTKLDFSLGFLVCEVVPVFILSFYRKKRLLF